MRFSWLALALLAVPGLPAQADSHLPDCRAEVDIFPGTTLAGLADLYYGDVDYRYAILLATNARSSDPSKTFPFIGDPYRLPKTGKLCIPIQAEAEMERNRYLNYEDAVHDMAHAVPSEITDNLDAIDTSGPVTVVTWMRDDQIAWYKYTPGETRTIDRQTWVTIVPNLQEFCQAHVTARGPDPRALTLRIEQRLGLPPNSADTTFVEFLVENTGDTAQIFKPCVSPDVTATTCGLGPLTDCSKAYASDTEIAACEAHNDFFTGQYYGSYGLSRPSEYPWTSLGYTFDWTFKPLGHNEKPGFVQYGESEFVIPATATVTVKSVTKTADYCAPG